ncbi:MAG: hypothetical protein WCB49_01230 [Gammaproteobacteria bacterium]
MEFPTLQICNFHVNPLDLPASEEAKALVVRGSCSEMNAHVAALTARNWRRECPLAILVVIFIVGEIFKTIFSEDRAGSAGEIILQRAHEPVAGRGVPGSVSCLSGAGLLVLTTAIPDD